MSTCDISKYEWSISIFEHFMTKFHELPEQPSYKLNQSRSDTYLQGLSQQIVEFLNLLHAEVSYIIHTACHCTFFSIFLVLPTFWSPKPRFFSIFQLPIFAKPYPSNLCSPMFGECYWAKTCYQPIFRHCLGAVLQYLATFYENLH